MPVFGSNDESFKPREIRHRMTVRVDMYHQVHNRDADHFPFVYTRDLANEEQPYDRVVKTRSEPIPLPLGWVGEQQMHVALTHISNLGLRDQNGKLVPAEQNPNAWVDIYVPGDKLKIRVSPGEVQMFSPNVAEQMVVEGSVENIEIRVVVVPG